MLQIGLVCEGDTDQVAIEHYFRQSLLNRQISDIKFLRLPLSPDNTISGEVCGWGMVLRWLCCNPPERRRHYLHNLFDHNLYTLRCDAIVIHLDADILSDPDFQTYIGQHFQLTVSNVSTPRDKGREIAKVIEHVGKFSHLTNRDRARHVVAAAVESTETWCLAAVRIRQSDPEVLCGSQLRHEFMTALHKCEGSSNTGPFRRISKDVRRRTRFCRVTARHANRIETQCYHYEKLVMDVVRVLPP